MDFPITKIESTVLTLLISADPNFLCISGMSQQNWRVAHMGSCLYIAPQAKLASRPYGELLVHSPPVNSRQDQRVAWAPSRPLLWQKVPSQKQFGRAK